MVKIAIPLAEGKLCMHFGHCEEFAIIDADEKSKKIIKKECVVPPPHEPGVLPKWLGGMGVKLVIAGGMGERARNLFTGQGIRVLTGAPADSPDHLVMNFFEGTLQLGENVCDH